MEHETMVPMTVEDDDIKIQDQNGFDAAKLATEETYDPEEIRICLPTPESFADKKPTFKAGVERSLDVVAEKIGHRGLVLLTIFLVLLLIVVIILLMWPRLPHHSLAAKCTKPHCLRAAAMYVETMNGSIDPCEDPWQWACGSWLNDNTTRLRGNWAKRDELWLQELTKVRDVVSSMTDVGGPDTVNWKLKTLYESCMAVDDIGSHNDFALMKIISDLGGWSVLRDWSHSSWDLAKVLTRLHARHGAAPFFSVSLGGDPTRPGALLLTLDPGGLGLPDRGYYYTGTQSQMVVAYKRLMRDVVSLLGANSRDAAIFADDVFGYEQRLAFITPERSELATRGPSLVTLGDLKMTTQSLLVQDILSALFPRARINDSTKILLSSPFYISHLSVVISATDRSILNNYLIWTMVREYLPYMSDPFTHVLHEYTSHLTGSSYQPPRWEFCTSLLYKTLPLAVNAIVENCTDRQINNDFKHSTIQNIFAAIKISTSNKIKKAHWINRVLKTHLLQKVDVMTLEVELPLFTLQPAYLKEHYSSLLIQKHDLFQNVRFGFDFARDRMQLTFLSSLKSEERLIPPSPDMMSVKYYESRNAIVVPRLLANPPYYHPNYPISIQYGRLGVQISIALAGVILSAEPLQMPDVRVDSHLSPVDESIEKYVRQATNLSQHCLQNVLQYKFGVNDTIANTTKMNTLIHLSGVKIALDAMEWRLNKDIHPNDRHEHIPGLEIYEDTAVFALSYAQDQCALESPQKNVMENFVNLQLQKKTLFEATWSQVNKFKEYLDCSKSKLCAEVL